MGIVNYPSKITTKNIALGKRRLEDLAEEYAREKEVAVMRVDGTVFGMKEEVGEFGPYQRFTGAFAALSFVDKAEYRSRTMIVPPLAEMIVQGKVHAAIDDQGIEPSDKGEYKLVSPVKVLFDVTIKYNPSEKGTRFVFGARDLQQTESPFQALLDSTEKEKGLFLGAPEAPKETPKKPASKGGGKK